MKQGQRRKSYLAVSMMCYEVYKKESKDQESNNNLDRTANFTLNKSLQ